MRTFSCAARAAAPATATVAPAIAAPTIVILAMILLLTPATATHAAEATYRATFENLWNSSDHPLNYPSNQHFSPLVGASHQAGVSFWSTGVLATPGVEAVAERGTTGSFISEANAAIGQGDALQAIAGAGNIFVGQSTESDTFTVNDRFPLVTLLSMIAPSPDWFVGIHDYNLRSGPGFAESVVLEFDTFYDAGTEEGDRFSTSNPATNPLENIALVAGAEAASVFVTAQPGPRTQLAPIARLTLTRLSQTVPEPSTLAALLIALTAPLCRRPARA